jgi:hypothetical protein
VRVVPGFPDPIFEVGIIVSVGFLISERVAAMVSVRVLKVSIRIPRV